MFLCVTVFRFYHIEVHKNVVGVTAYSFWSFVVVVNWGSTFLIDIVILAHARAFWLHDGWCSSLWRNLFIYVSIWQLLS